MNLVDALVSYFAPNAALKRRLARNALAYYEAAKPSRLRKFHNDLTGPNWQTQQGAMPIRAQARHLVQNHDIARGALRTLVNNVVGPKGIGIEPQPRKADGTIHRKYADDLLHAFNEWAQAPEVTRQHHWQGVQRLMVQSWIRDGEAFVQQVTGKALSLAHASRVPLSLALLEADRIPYYYTDTEKHILQGIERDSWGKPVAYWTYLKNPDDMQYLSMPVITLPTNLKRVPASQMLHVATIDRIGQARGVSEFASVITRLEDIKDYEESERVAAKIAAMLTAYVKRGNPQEFDPSQLPTDEYGNRQPRDLALQPGMIIDSLVEGEEIGLIDSKRPNPNLITFRQGQLRAVAAGIGASYSSISRDYNGTFSAQRQELVEQWVHYAVLTDEFVGDFIQPVWKTFVETADLAGIVPVPRGIKPGTEADAAYVGQSMPWIDPVKEANAWLLLTQAGFASEPEVIRKRGVNPQDVLDQTTEFRRQAKERDLIFSSNAASSSPGATDKEISQGNPSND